MTPKGRGALLVRLICLGSALLWIVLVATDRGLLERFELAALDTELRLGPPSHASPDIIIVAVDERAVHRYGPPRDFANIGGGGCCIWAARGRRPQRRRCLRPAKCTRLRPACRLPRAPTVI